MNAYQQTILHENFGRKLIKYPRTEFVSHLFQVLLATVLVLLQVLARELLRRQLHPHLQSGGRVGSGVRSYPNAV
jgi:energy-converting hydrogenase Eha subunit F